MLPKFSIRDLVYMDRPPRATLPTSSNADIYKKLLLKAYGHFQFLQVTQHILTVDEYRIPDTIPVDKSLR